MPIPIRHGSHERVVTAETELRQRALSDRLPVANPHSSANVVRQLDDRVADLVNTAGVLGRRAIGDALAFEVQRASPGAVMVPVEAKVQPGSEVETRI